MLHENVKMIFPRLAAQLLIVYYLVNNLVYMRKIVQEFFYYKYVVKTHEILQLNRTEWLPEIAP